MGQAAITAAETTLSQMKAVNSSYTYANVGLTPMLGINDDGTTFTLADAGIRSSVGPARTASAASPSGPRTATWSVPEARREKGADLRAAASCSPAARTRRRSQSGSGGGGTPPTTPPPTTAPPTTVPCSHAIVNNNSSLCLSDSGDSSTLKTTGDIASCDSSAAQSWTAENGTLVDGNNLCLSVTGSSTALKAVTDIYTCNGSPPARTGP
jgi:hypothetical protein